jgi:hypothetical protein
MSRPEISEGFTLKFFVGTEIVQTDRHICTPSRVEMITVETWNVVKSEGCTGIEVVRESDNKVFKRYNSL